jgi:hypothetical protein
MKCSTGQWLGVASVGFLVFAAACSQTGPGGTTGTGGSTGNGGTTSSGGATGTGGVTDTGGSTGTGGSSTSTGGNTGTGGGVSTGGSTGTGGASSTGGTTGTGGAGGKPATGGTTGTGGNTSTGGTTGTGGVGGKPATGGTTGTGGAAGSGAITAASVVPGLVNMYWEGTCVGTRDPGGHNCPLDDNGSNCPTNTDPTKQGTVRSKVLNVGGTANQPYTINIEVIGVIGTRCYSGGTRQSTASISTDGYNNSWYIGGTPSNSTDWWNSYEIHVAPSTGAADVYYLNAFDNSGGNYCDAEATYLVRYPASFKVLGGGTITLKLHDYNCQAQQNCGSNTDSASTCMPRTVDFQSFDKTIQNSFMAGTQTKTGTLVQPPTNQLSKTYNPQFLMIEVTSVTSP